MSTVTESFGSMVFDERAMKARLSGSVYHAMKQTLQGLREKLRREDREPKEQAEPAAEPAGAV